MNRYLVKIQKMAMMFVALMIVVACSKDKDEPTAPVVVDPTPVDVNPQPEERNIEAKDLWGTWYIESDNEQVTFLESGRFYDYYCNSMHSNYTEGTFEVAKNNKITETYTFYGQPVFTELTVMDFSNNSMKVQNERSQTLYFKKIVDTINLPLNGETNHDSVKGSVRSTDESIVKVESDGTIVSSGQKGYAYLSINDSYYVKVCVGVDDIFYDLWYNYGNSIGRSYAEIKNKYGEPSQIENNIVAYMDMGLHSEYVDYITMSFDDNQNTDYIGVYFHEGISYMVLRDYLNKRFFPTDISDVWTSDQLFNEGTYNIVLSTNLNCLIISNKEAESDLWPDYSQFIGKSRSEIESTISNKVIHSDNESIYFEEKDNEYVRWFIYKFNKSNIAYDLTLYLHEKVDKDAILTYLRSIYSDYMKGTNDNQFAFLNADNPDEVTLGIVYRPSENIIRIIDLTQEVEEETGLWPDYVQYIGKSYTEIENMFSSNILQSDAKSIYCELTGNEFVRWFIFGFNSKKEANTMSLYLHENADENKIVSFLSSKYNVYEPGTEEDYYAFIDGEDLASSTIGITYDVTTGLIAYVSLTLSRE